MSERIPLRTVKRDGFWQSQHYQDTVVLPALIATVEAARRYTREAFRADGNTDLAARELMDTLDRFDYGYEEPA